MTEPLGDLSRAAGILPDYIDLDGRTVAVGPDTQRALLAAMGLPATTTAEATDTLASLRAGAGLRALPSWIVTEAGRPGPDLGTWQITSEDGATREGRGPVPALPFGLHRLAVEGTTSTLLAAPAALPLPERAWGLTGPLYGLRPDGTGGIGSYRDLARAVGALGPSGAAFLGINPVHAGFPEDAQAISPYSPSHRRMLSASHVEAPGERAAPDGALIDYPAAQAARRAAQEATFAAQPPDPAFDEFVARGGEALARFALHQALSERHGPYWHDWPAALREPGASDAPDLAPRMRFHTWLQWQADAQLAKAARAAREAGMAHGLYLDLAVGTHPAGAETWADPALFARGVSLGAPPDAFAPQGQSWGLAPFNPRTLVSTGFAALAQTLRQQLRYAGMLRIDHILGFERTFWVPTDGTTPGAYVAMPREAMLAVARIEAARAGAVIVGEDLGNIPEGLQDALMGSGILGCRVMMFERDTLRGAAARFHAPDSYRPATLASFGTHDLPPFAGWREATDLGAREALGLVGREAAGQARRLRDREVAGLDRLIAPVRPEDATDAMHRTLGATGSRLVALQIEDILRIKGQANLPGTVKGHPNWRRRLPVNPDTLAADPRFARAARQMNDAGR